jgi:hypothetical protein
MNDHWSGANFKAGELVQIRERHACLSKESSSYSPHKVGIVIDYWPSNVYEPSSYDILIDGNIRSYDTKYVYENDARFVDDL